ncbi:alcohol dehydrogenase catalytic domain-containing protein [Salinispira pacifica]
MGVTVQRPVTTRRVSGLNVSMRGAVLPGDSSVVVREFPVPRPAAHQVLVRVKAAAVTDGDVHTAYRQHVEDGLGRYSGVICGRETSGVVQAVGARVESLAPGDRVAVYPVAGCGECPDCSRGYPTGCTGSTRIAYGRSRNGGMAEYLLAEEGSCILLPEPLSHVDGALLSCTFSTAWEALLRLQIDQEDRLLVVGADAVAMATMMLARSLGVTSVSLFDENPASRKRALERGLTDFAAAGPNPDGEGGWTAVVECSGDPEGRVTALRSAARWGRVAFVGEGSSMLFEPAQDLIRRQLTLHGVYGARIDDVRGLAAHLAERSLHPSEAATHCFSFADVETAYRTADECGSSGCKVIVVFDQP